MTKEEAKIKIGELGMYARTQEWDDEYTEAVNMAIKALEQEPCEDAISRKDILNAVFEDDYMKNHMNGDTWERLEELIGELPPVQPKQKMGYWIPVDDSFKCSECGELSCCKGKYCNECGAKMAESEDKE